MLTCNMMDFVENLTLTKDRGVGFAGMKALAVTLDSLPVVMKDKSGSLMC